jgi:hypothetical protein
MINIPAEENQPTPTAVIGRGYAMSIFKIKRLYFLAAECGGQWVAPF